MVSRVIAAGKYKGDVCKTDESLEKEIKNSNIKKGRVDYDNKYRYRYKLLNIPIRLGDISFVPEDFYTAFFRHMKERVRKVSDEPLENTYITYPASFGKKKKEKIVNAAKAKHHLSIAKKYDESIEIGFDLVPYHLSKEQFEEMIAGLVGQTINVCYEILHDAGVEVKDLSAVFMVGGTSRVPLVQEMVRRFAGNIPVQCAENLEIAVAEGALKFYEQIPEGCTEEVKQY